MDLITRPSAYCFFSHCPDSPGINERNSPGRRWAQSIRETREIAVNHLIVSNCINTQIRGLPDFIRETQARVGPSQLLARTERLPSPWGSRRGHRAIPGDPLGSRQNATQESRSEACLGSPIPSLLHSGTAVRLGGPGMTGRRIRQHAGSSSSGTLRPTSTDPTSSRSLPHSYNHEGPVASEPRAGAWSSGARASV